MKSLKKLDTIKWDIRLLKNADTMVKVRLLEQQQKINCVVLTDTFSFYVHSTCKIFVYSQLL